MEQQETITINNLEYVKKDSIKENVEVIDGLTYSIIRTYSAGVFAGYIDRKREVKKEATISLDRTG